MSIFTFKEKTLKRHDVNFIATQIRSVLNERRIRQMCTNKLPYDSGQLYTTEQASRIIDSVVWDSVYHSTGIQRVPSKYQYR